MEAILFLVDPEVLLYSMILIHRLLLTVLKFVQLAGDVDDGNDLSAHSSERVNDDGLELHTYIYVVPCIKWFMYHADYRALLVAVTFKFRFSLHIKSLMHFKCCSGFQHHLVCILETCIVNIS